MDFCILPQSRWPGPLGLVVYTPGLGSTPVLTGHRPAEEPVVRADPAAVASTHVWPTKCAASLQDEGPMAAQCDVTNGISYNKRPISG